QQLTACPAIGNLIGRLYCSDPSPDHYISWHSDMGDHRLVGISINLTSTDYAGGVFEMREAKTKRLLYEFHSTSLGDAHLFRLDPSVEHRVTPVTGSVSRMAYSGWFRAQPHYASIVQDMFQAETALPTATS
ncbi:MAG: 2OG-Fe(II) oxygenase family protein, partial [Candidatus Tectomicrobia bacterium]|nr:2OG-Fe(II) oxygenase family protein [Candidatus Tectomicrobia bacterium]